MIYFISISYCFIVRERLSVGTVPADKMHPVGTVPTDKMHPVGTVPTDKMHPVGTLVFLKIYFYELEFGLYSKNK